MTNAEAWDYAIGMIKVDGLEPTAEYKEYIDKEIRGELSMADLKKYLDEKYKCPKDFLIKWELLSETAEVLCFAIFLRSGKSQSIIFIAK